jgi:RNA-directed DNA polymerase
MESVASAHNLAQALLNVSRNKGAPGVHDQTVEEMVEQAPSLLPKLQTALLQSTYQPGDIRRLWIAKPGGGQRGLGIPNVMDRWVRQAVLQILEPIFEPTFHASSHGFRPNRGAHTAIAEAKEHLKAGYRVLVDRDLSKFFDRVHHQRLLERLRQRVHDSRSQAAPASQRSLDQQTNSTNMKNSLNSVRTRLKVLDTHRNSENRYCRPSL